MAPQSVKMTFVIVWVVSVLIVGLVVGASSAGSQLAIAAFGLLPPYATLLFRSSP